MADQRTGVLEQIKQVWLTMTGRRKVTFIAVGAGTFLLLAYIGLSGSDNNYKVLYSGLAQTDAAEVVEQLKSKDVPFRIREGGVIEVPADKIHQLRLQLASAGFPRGGGVGFEIFDKQSFGTTNFVEQVNYRRAMQGELARTISALDTIESARVHLAVGRKSVFRKAEDAPSASVSVRLRRGRKLSTTQVRGIVHLVSSSVNGLKPERVVVVDERGGVLSSSDDQRGNNDAKSDLERTLASRIEKMIGRVVGPKHVAVEVTADVDFSKVQQTEETYDPKKTVLRSEARTVEGAGAKNMIGGIAGARGNLPGAKPAAKKNGKGGIDRLSQTRNFEINRVVRRIVKPSLKVRRLHVAVLVDYKVKPEAASKGAKGKRAKKRRKKKKGAKDTVEMIPRTEAELAHIMAIARQAAGIDSKRGDEIEVRNARFHPTDAEGTIEEAPTVAAVWPLSRGITVAASAAIVCILFAFVAVFLLRRRGGMGVELMQLPATVSDMERVLESRGEVAALSAGSAPLALNGENLNDRVASAVRSDTPHAAGVIKSWLAGSKAS